MDFDQAYSGPIDWNFPSPTATPTTSAFAYNALETPKTATYPTNFQDAFATPHMSDWATPRQPIDPTMTPVRRPQSSSDIMYSHPPDPSQLLHEPPIPPQQMGLQHPSMSSQNPATVQDASMTSRGAISGVDLAFQMQTPPPTRGTSARKSRPLQVALGTPSTIASRRFMTPQQPQVHMQPQSHEQHRQILQRGPQPGLASTPQQIPGPFPALNFSPDIYQLNNFGPSSAPVFPQSQILWDHGGSSGLPSTQPPLDDPFAPTMSNMNTSGHFDDANANAAWSGLATRQAHDQAALFKTPNMRSFPVQPPPERAASMNSFLSGFTAGPPLPPVSTSVDPSLVYSSPVRLDPTDQKDTRTHLENSLFAREPELPRSQRDPFVSKSLAETKRPVLSRSHTTGNTRNRGPIPSFSAAVAPVPRSVSLAHPPRTVSPMKRTGRLPSLGSISETKRRTTPSVVLTIDEYGRARTENRKSEKSPTRSIRERYPVLFDSDSSDGEESDSSETPSRTGSFNFAKGEERRAKVVKLDPPVENLEGLTLPRTASSASLKSVAPSKAAIAAAAHLRRHGSLRKTSNSRTIQSRRSSTAIGSHGSTKDIASLAVSTDSLHSLHSNTSQLSGTISPTSTEADSLSSWPEEGRNTLGPGFVANPFVQSNQSQSGSRRWSTMSLDQSLPTVSQTIRQADLRQDTVVRNNRHSTQPFTYGQQQQQYDNPLIRCQCGTSVDNGLPLIQCVSCTQWLHTSCIAPESLSHPTQFTCFLCTKPEPGIHSRRALGRA